MKKLLILITLILTGLTSSYAQPFPTAGLHIVRENFRTFTSFYVEGFIGNTATVFSYDAIQPVNPGNPIVKWKFFYRGDSADVNIIHSTLEYSRILSGKTIKCTVSKSTTGNFCKITVTNFSSSLDSLIVKAIYSNDQFTTCLRYVPHPDYISKLKTDSTLLQSRISSLKTDSTNSHTQINNQQNFITNLTDSISGLNNRISFLNDSASVLNGQVDFLAGFASILSDSITSLNSHVSSLNDTITYLKAHPTYVTDTISNDTLYINIHTGIPTPSNKINALKVYPNPASDIIYIELENSGIYTAKIAGVNGSTQVTNTLNGAIDISNLANGIYILSIFDSKGQLVTTNRISVNR